jgi:hypothetical protein
MGVQTDLRAGGGLGRCCNCGTLVYIDDVNISWNVQFNVFGNNYNIVDQHND